MSYDASPSWSGFNYQGKVALFHVLKIIREKLQDNPGFNFDDYDFILENNEDFDLREGGNYKSFHQVKAVNKNNYSDYSNAFLAMVLQLNEDDFQHVSGVFHTWKQIRFQGDLDLKSSITQTISGLIEGHNQDNANSAIAKAVLDNGQNLSKASRIIKAAFSSNQQVTAAQVIEVFSDIVSEQNDVIDRVSICIYPDNNLFCELEEINNKVESLIDEILIIKGLPSPDELVRRIFNALLGKLDTNVQQRHRQNANGEAATSIQISDILGVVIDGAHADLPEEILAFEFKKLFVETFEDFLDENGLGVEDEGGFYHKDSDLSKVMGELFNINAMDLWSYYKCFSPHINLSEYNNIQKAIKIELGPAKESLFRTFDELPNNKIINQGDKKQIRYSQNNEEYLPTTIAYGKPENIVKAITKNPLMVESLFEIAKYICSENIPKSNFIDVIDKLDVVTLEDRYLGDHPKDKEKINELIRGLQLIPISEAKESINND